MKRVALVVVLVAFLAVSFLALDSYAEMQGKGMKKDGGMCKMCKMKKMGDMDKKDLTSKFYMKAWVAMENQEELGLTDKQVGQIKTLKYETKKDVIKKNAEIDVIAVDIKVSLWEDSIDTQSVNMLVDKKYNLKAEKTKTIINAMAKFKSILTKDQMTKLKDLCKKNM